MRALTRLELVGLCGGGLLVAGALLLATMNMAIHLSESPPALQERSRAESIARLAAARDDYDRWCALPSAALAHALRGNAPEATALARETLALVPRYAKDWNHGNAIHKANLALGHVALRSGDREAAKAYLLAAGDTPGSPQLDSFGPDMSLARELLRAGERETVLDYLDRVNRFWALDFGAVATWKIAIGLGFSPGFGANGLH